MSHRSNSWLRCSVGTGSSPGCGGWHGHRFVDGERRGATVGRPVDGRREPAAHVDVRDVVAADVKHVGIGAARGEQRDGTQTHDPRTHAISHVFVPREVRTHTAPGRTPGDERRAGPRTGRPGHPLPGLMRDAERYRAISGAAREKSRAKSGSNAIAKGGKLSQMQLDARWARRSSASRRVVCSPTVPVPPPARSRCPPAAASPARSARDRDTAPPLPAAARA
jgi:hypothetical protein